MAGGCDSNGGDSAVGSAPGIEVDGLNACRTVFWLHGSCNGRACTQDWLPQRPRPLGGNGGGSGTAWLGGGRLRCSGLLVLRLHRFGLNRLPEDLPLQHPRQVTLDLCCRTSSSPRAQSVYIAASRSVWTGASAEPRPRFAPFSRAPCWPSCRECPPTLTGIHR